MWWLLLLLLLVQSVRSSFLEARFLSTYKNAELGNYYLCTLSIGSPKEQVRLAVTFAHSYIRLSSRLYDLKYSSSTWLPAGDGDGIGTDQVMISGDVFLWPFVHDFDAPICNGLCAGEIGLGPGSNLWSIWNSAFFYPTFVRLSAPLPVPETTVSSFSFTKATQSTVLVNVHDTGVVKAKMVGVGRIGLPQSLYEEVMYWNGNVTIKQLGFTMDLQSVQRKTYRGVTELKIRQNDASTDYIELGSMLFEKYNLYINYYDDNLELHLGTGDSSGRTIKPWHTVLILIFWFIYLYWKTVDINFMFNYQLSYWTMEKKSMNPDHKVYWLTKGGHSFVLTLEIISTAVVYFINGPPTYLAEVDFFFSITFWIAWATLFVLSLLVWLNVIWLGNFDPLILQFSTWFRASADICLLSLIVILLLNGTNIDVGVGIIIIFFQSALLYSFFRTTLSFIILMTALPRWHVMGHIVLSAIWTGLGTWISWAYFFNSFLMFISDALSVNVNLISAVIVTLAALLVSYFHRLFLLANIYNRLHRAIKRSKVKTK